MKPELSLERFQEFLTAHHVELADLTPETGINLALSFYRAEQSDVQAVKADTLLYQWGTYDWGKGEFFNIDISRQFILDEIGEDESIWQLSLTFKFQPTDALLRLEPGNKWCESTLDVEAFHAYIRSTPAFQSVQDRRADVVELDFGCAG